jgi:acylphosphatase
VIRRVAFRVHGLVQGVAYRASAQHAAQRERLVGWVRNRDDGDVEGEAEGDAEAIDRFLAWCRGGPPSARVTGLEVCDRPARASEMRFEIRR